MKHVLNLVLLSFFQLINYDTAFGLTSCNNNYLVFDIGSTSTKSFIYNEKSLRLEKTGNYPFSYQNCLNESTNNTLSNNCIAKGVELLAKIKKEYNFCETSPQSFALATAWARNTLNIDQWQKEVSKIGIESKVISQNYEGELMMNAIKLQVAKVGEKFLAFDIGGGSFQIVPSDKGLKQYHGNFGGDSFTYRLEGALLSEDDKCCARARDQFFLELEDSDKIEKLCQEKCLTSIAKKDLAKALSFADQLIGKPIRDNKELQKFIKENQPKLYASSLFFSMGIKEQLKLNKNQVTLEDLMNLINLLSEKSFQEIKDLYPTIPDSMVNSRQPGLILLYTILKNLDLPAFEIVEIDHMQSFLNSSITKKSVLE